MVAITQWTDPVLLDLVTKNKAVHITELRIAVNTLENTVDNHLAHTMPHLLVNQKTGKTYRYGKRVGINGKLQLIYEEVL